MLLSFIAYIYIFNQRHVYVISGKLVLVLNQVALIMGSISGLRNEVTDSGLVVGVVASLSGMREGLRGHVV